MSTFIKSIGGVRFNNLGADLYENNNGTATIRFDKLTHDLPKKHWMKFDSLESAEQFIEKKQGSNRLNTLINVIESANL